MISAICDLRNKYIHIHIFQAGFFLFLATTKKQVEARHLRHETKELQMLGFLELFDLKNGGDVSSRNGSVMAD